MFSHAQSAIRILTGELNAFAYGTSGVIARARQFMADSNHSLQIALTDDFDDSAALRHPLLAALGPGSNVTLIRVPSEFAKHIPCHFAVMDDDSYRYEGDKTKPAAIAVFGDRAFAGELTKLFSAISRYSGNSSSLDSIRQKSLAPA
jgi:hypothetical protein